MQTNKKQPPSDSNIPVHQNERQTFTTFQDLDCVGSSMTGAAVSATTKKNPLREDSRLRELLEQLNSVQSVQAFEKWNDSFLNRLDVFLDDAGSDLADRRYRAMGTLMTKLMQTVEEMESLLLQNQDPTVAGVKARKAVSNTQSQLRSACDELASFIPGTVEESKRLGYSKFHMGAALVRDHFGEYDRLNKTNQTLQRAQETLAHHAVIDQPMLDEFKRFGVRLESFCTIMADLGLYEVMVKCQEELENETSVHETADEQGTKDPIKSHEGDKEQTNHLAMEGSSSENGESQPIPQPRTCGQESVRPGMFRGGSFSDSTIGGEDDGDDESMTEGNKDKDDDHDAANALGDNTMDAHLEEGLPLVEDLPPPVGTAGFVERAMRPGMFRGASFSDSTVDSEDGQEHARRGGRRPKHAGNHPDENSDVRCDENDDNDDEEPDDQDDEPKDAPADGVLLVDRGMRPGMFRGASFSSTNEGDHCNNGIDSESDCDEEDDDSNNKTDTRIDNKKAAGSVGRALRPGLFRGASFSDSSCCDDHRGDEHGKKQQTRRGGRRPKHNLKDNWEEEDSVGEEDDGNEDGHSSKGGNWPSPMYHDEICGETGGSDDDLFPPPVREDAMRPDMFRGASFEDINDVMEDENRVADFQEIQQPLPEGTSTVRPGVFRGRSFSSESTIDGGVESTVGDDDDNDTNADSEQPHHEGRRSNQLVNDFHDPDYIAHSHVGSFAERNVGADEKLIHHATVLETPALRPDLNCGDSTKERDQAPSQYKGSAREDSGCSPATTAGGSEDAAGQSPTGSQHQLSRWDSSSPASPPPTPPRLPSHTNHSARDKRPTSPAAVNGGESNPWGAIQLKSVNKTVVADEAGDMVQTGDGGGDGRNSALPSPPQCSRGSKDSPANVDTNEALVTFDIRSRGKGTRDDRNQTVDSNHCQFNVPLNHAAAPQRSVTEMRSWWDIGGGEVTYNGATGEQALDGRVRYRNESPNAPMSLNPAVDQDGDGKVQFQRRKQHFEASESDYKYKKGSDAAAVLKQGEKPKSKRGADNDTNKEPSNKTPRSKILGYTLQQASKKRDKCYMWYARMGQPNREKMKRLVRGLPPSCGIVEDDVDLLPWIWGGRACDVKQMTALISKATLEEIQQKVAQSQS